MNTFFNIIEPISNLPVFIFLNLLICGIVIHWYWSIVTENFSDRTHRFLQRLGLFISILIIGILFVKQWNIGDLLAFYSIFSLGILIHSLVTGHKEIIKESRGWFLSIFLVFFIRGYVYEPWQIPSGSMKPNLEVGDFVLVNRNAYGLEIPFTGRDKVFSKGPEVGEIVVFFPPHKPTVPFVKRVIAKGGDKISYINKKFYINRRNGSFTFRIHWDIPWGCICIYRWIVGYADHAYYGRFLCFPSHFACFISSGSAWIQLSKYCVSNHCGLYTYLCKSCTWSSIGSKKP